MNTLTPYNMTELLYNEHYKIATIELTAGTNMPRHFSDCEGYLIVEKGNALLIYPGETYELSSGSNLSIPPNEHHLIKVIEDFKAYLILGNKSSVTFPELA